MPQPCPRKLRPVALAEVLMMLAESCVIEQHIDRLLRGVERMNLGLGTPDVRTTWRWHPRWVRMLTSCLPLSWKTPTAELSLLRFARHDGSLATRGFGRDSMMAGLLTERREEAGKDPELCKLCLCSGQRLPSQTRWLHARSRGLACRMT